MPDDIDVLEGRWALVTEDHPAEWATDFYTLRNGTVWKDGHDAPVGICEPAGPGAAVLALVIPATAELDERRLTITVTAIPAKADAERRPLAASDTVLEARVRHDDPLHDWADFHTFVRVPD